ncbi:MAG: hypothetical protein ACE5OT_02460 [Candidatus Hadarchaeaceae archaeon]
MGDSAPSVQEWKNLYDLALEFKKIGCWDWMWDSDIFGVQNPESGEIGYCCVMGKLGQHYALAVYLGTEGLDGYLKIQSEEISPDDIDALHVQKCLMISFEDRKFLRKPDFQVIKQLGLKFRGRNSWPLFRSYRPGYPPWYLTREEAEYLTLVLQQAIGVVLRFKKDKDMLTPPKKNHYLIRVPEKEGGSLRWKDKWLEPPPLEKTEVVAGPIDEARLERIKRTVSRQRGTWEADFFYFPGAVKEKEGERPYYPYAILFVDHPSSFIFGTDLVTQSELRLEFGDKFLGTIESVEFIPKEVLVKKEEAFKILEPIASRLGVEIRKVERLMALEEAQAGMFEFFRA